MIPITGVILTHNEERNIERCITHLRPHVAEIILIDTNSSDRTVEIAKPFVDRILTHENVPNFDALRNLAIPVARHTWMWFVDADEFVPQKTGEFVQQWISEAGDQFEALRIPFKSYFCGQWMKHCGWWPGYTSPRVLKKGSFEFGVKLHSGVRLQGREMLAPPDPSLGIDHFSYRNLHHWVEKFNRYTSTEAQQLAAEGVVYDWRDAVRAMATDLWGHYEFHNAQQDGQRGWILTMCNAFYRWMSYAKLIDCDPADCDPAGESVRQSGVAPSSLNEFLDCVESELSSRRRAFPIGPLAVILHAPVWEAGEASADARRMAICLSMSSRCLKINAPIENPRPITLSPAEVALLRAHSHTQRQHSAVAISYLPYKVADHTACYNVFRSLDAVDLIGPDAHQPQGFDEIWVRDVKYRDALLERGGQPERIRCVAPDSIPLILDEIESALAGPPLPEASDSQWHVSLEGEFFSGHSYSNINERMAGLLTGEDRVALTLNQVVRAPTDCSSLASKRLRPYVGRKLKRPLDATIRHMFPPDWTRPKSGCWILILHWEFGYLPEQWVAKINSEVDEVWVVSKYVMDVYVRSGVDATKLHYVPLGIEPAVFRPDGPKRGLPLPSSFRFLYVGGTILRKGFDRVLAAYLQEFSADDDVCLVVKDTGSQTFYRSLNMREQILQALRDPRNPRIVYYEEEFTAGQLAALYRACNCLVAPYRGEGFGLPVLEAMACGVTPIVPKGGATDDFATAETAYLLPSQVMPVSAEAGLDERATELHVEVSDVAAAMRLAFRQASQTSAMGKAAAEQVRHRWTWEQTRQCMVRRLEALCRSRIPPELHQPRVGDTKPPSWPKSFDCREIGRWLAKCGATQIAVSKEFENLDIRSFLQEWKGDHLHIVDFQSYQEYGCKSQQATNLLEAIGPCSTTIQSYKPDAVEIGRQLIDDSLDAVVWNVDVSEFEQCWHWLTTWYSKLRNHGMLYIYHSGSSIQGTAGGIMETAVRLFEHAFETSVNRRQSTEQSEWLILVSKCDRFSPQQVHMANPSQAVGDFAGPVSSRIPSS